MAASSDLVDQLAGLIVKGRNTGASKKRGKRNITNWLASYQAGAKTKKGASYLSLPGRVNK